MAVWTTELAPSRAAEGKLAPVSTWRIHIGAHKTATTHLQQTLAAIRPRLVEQGIDPIPLAALRASGFARMLIERRLATRMPLLRGLAVRQLVAEALEPLRQGPRTLILSEEKLLGAPRRVFEEPAYPLVEQVVPRLAALGGRGKVTLFLSIRGFDRHLPSTYAQELRVLPPSDGGFEAIRRRVMERPPSWFELILRIRRAAPGVPLRVWRQEDYRAHREAIVASLVGRATGPLPEIPVPVRTRSPSLEAIRLAEALPAGLPAHERRAEVDAIFAEGGEGTRFSPFTPTEEYRLQAAYADDMARIAALDPTILMRF
jgi:hypothetical protein